jgi:predicted nuclease with TOPRIM domain
MKEIEIKQKDQLEISIKQKKQIEKKLVGDIIPHNGHKIWKINKETLEIEEAKYLNTAFFIGEENKKEILVIDGFEYVSALNKKNALKLFAKGKAGGKEIIKNPLKLTN